MLLIRNDPFKMEGLSVHLAFRAATGPGSVLLNVLRDTG